MLDPRAIAALGLGRRPIVVAMLGIWDDLSADADPEEEEDPPRYWGPPMRAYIDQRPRRRRKECAVLLCGIG